MAQNIPVILARDVANLGRIGELVTVRPGYARNFLVPNGLALPASPKRVAQFEHQKRVIDHKRRVLRADSEKRAQTLAGVQVTLGAKMGDQGKLFGSITARDIAKALAAVGHDIHHKDVKLVDQIRTVGIHTVDVRLEADVTAQVKVIVVAEEEPKEAGAADEGDDAEDEAPAADAAEAPAADA
jgi:large subunit ribosomal protein L9